MAGKRPSCPNPQSMISRVAASAIKKDPYTIGATAPRNGKCPYEPASEEAKLWRMGNQDDESRQIMRKEAAAAGGVL